jgi:hypothetical protein
MPGLFSEKKINTKTIIQFDFIKISKNMHILVHNQNYEKHKKVEFQNPQTKVPPQL